MVGVSLQLLSWFDEMDCEVKRDQDKIYRLIK